MDKNCFFYNHERTNYCGDFIPFYDKKSDEYHLFYILGSSWYHISTKDFVNFKEYGLAIEGGFKEDCDKDIYTGCVVEKDGCYYIYYTGHNGEPDYEHPFREVTLRATSHDLIHWIKDKEWKLEPDTNYFGGGAWRDPYVFYDDDSQTYKMIITASMKYNVWKRWGCTAMYQSRDMLNWSYDSVMYEPVANDSHECGDVFKIGDWYYLVYSTYARNWETHYRMSKSINGPWLKPKEDMFDGRAYYAAKTVSNCKNRYLIGWACRKEEEQDSNPYGWSGSLVVHEIRQKLDGSLFAVMPESVEKAFSKHVSMSPGESLGVFKDSGNNYQCNSWGRFSCLLFEKMDYDESYLIKGKIRFKEKASAAGLMLRVDNLVLEHYYQVKINFLNEKFSLERASNFFENHKFDEERNIKISDQMVEFKILISGSMTVMYINDTALCARLYDVKDGSLGFFVEEGSAELFDLCVYKK